MRRLLVVLCAVLVAAAAQGCSGPEASAPGASTEEASSAPLPPSAAGTDVAPASPLAVVAGSGPTSVVNGVPMGFSSDAEGAEAAARQFVRASAAMVAMAPTDAIAAQREMAAAAAEEDLVSTRSAELQNIWGSAGPGAASYWYTPIASRASLGAPGKARAEVWYVGVIRSPLVPGLQVWATATYDLVWEDDDWRIGAESEMPGPVPVLPVTQKTPTSGAELDALLEGFQARAVAP